jgi:prophage maintenance system killer protein
MDNLQDNQLVIYKNENGEIQVNVQIRGETVWLTQEEISKLFNKDRTVITKHINKILAENELDNSVCAKIAHTASDGKKYDIKHYNLDMIISVGYRVNSKRGIEFRKWASKILKDYLIQGYSVNQDKITQDRLNELRQTIELLSNTLINQNLVNDTGAEVLSLIKAYTKTWDMLIKYDEDNLIIPVHLQESNSLVPNYQESVDAISALKLALKEGAGNLFGIERGDALKSILGNIDQTFCGEQLYRSTEEKAANLLYFLIKDHPFSDGNKRIGSLLFLFYLSKAGAPLKNIGISSMVSLTLLIAESNPMQKELMIKLVVNLINL